MGRVTAVAQSSTAEGLDILNNIQSKLVEKNFSKRLLRSATTDY